MSQIKVFFESLSTASVAQLGQIYARDAYFKDPFNEVTGVIPIQAIFSHMFTQVRDPRFVVHSIVAQGNEQFLTWDFIFGPPAKQTVVRGASHLRLDTEGKISYHRDYWDVAEELYEKVPVLGSLMRFLKRRLSS
jgi:steroid Delta-isomerase